MPVVSKEEKMVEEAEAMKKNMVITKGKAVNQYKNLLNNFDTRMKKEFGEVFNDLSLELTELNVKSENWCVCGDKGEKTENAKVPECLNVRSNAI